MMSNYHDHDDAKVVWCDYRDITLPLTFMIIITSVCPKLPIQGSTDT